MLFLKALALGAILTIVIALIVGYSGSTGGLLAVRSVLVNNIQFYWSWALFLIGSGLAFAILLLMD